MAKKKKKKWIQDAIEHPGALKRKAKEKDMSLSQYMAHPPKGIRSSTKRQIALARRLKAMHR